jgi:hypothetical protein
MDVSMIMDTVKNASTPHKIITGLLVFLILVLIVKALRGGNDKPAEVKPAETKKERYGAEGSRNLVSTMSEDEYNKRKEVPECKVASANFCNSYCNAGTSEDIHNNAQTVMDQCGAQFPVLRTCPMECILPQYLTTRGGLQDKTMTDKVWPSYKYPDTVDWAFPGVQQGLQFDDAAPNMN